MLEMLEQFLTIHWIQSNWIAILMFQMRKYNPLTM